MNTNQLVEAIIFASGEPIRKKDIIDKISFLTPKEFDKIIAELKKKYNKENCGIVLASFNGKMQFVSNAKFGEQVAEVLTPIKEKSLSKTLLEVLSIIAYKQPVTRLDIEEIRGVSSEYAISMLAKYSLIDVIGRKEAVGRPLLYGTTDAFLRKFQIEDLTELPDYKEVLEHLELLDEQYPKNTDDLFAKKNVADDSELDSKIDDEIKKHNENATVDGQISMDDVNKITTDIEDEDEDLPDFLKGEKVEYFN